MLYFLFILIGWGLSSFLYIYYLPVLNNWFYAIYILAGLLTSLIIFIIKVLFLVLTFFRIAKPTNRLKHWILWQYCDFFLIFFRVRLKVIGKENIPSTPYVIYANHKSLMDVVILYRVYRRIMSAIAKKTLTKVWIAKIAMESFAVVPIDRENDREAAKSLVQAIKNIKEMNLNYFIFPEGGIKSRETDLMVNVKPGAYKLAQKSGATISPVSLIGTSKISKRRFLSWSKVTVIIHKPIYKEEYDDLNTIELGDKIFNIVNEGINNGR